MAVFNKNSLAQISGFDNPIIAGELVYQQKTFWNLDFTNDGVVVPLTGATISAQIIRRTLSNVHDTRYGLTFDIGDFTPPPSPVNLTIENLNEAAGTFTLVIDDTAWLAVAGDADLDIASINGAGFSGRIKIGFPAVGSTPAQDMVIFLLFIVRSDGVVN
jgi:hypothetical protein